MLAFSCKWVWHLLLPEFIEGKEKERADLSLESMLSTSNFYLLHLNLCTGHENKWLQNWCALAHVVALCRWNKQALLLFLTAVGAKCQNEDSNWKPFSFQLVHASWATLSIRVALRLPTGHATNCGFCSLSCPHNQSSYNVLFDVFKPKDEGYWVLDEQGGKCYLGSLLGRRQYTYRVGQP